MREKRFEKAKKKLPSDPLKSPPMKTKEERRATLNKSVMPFGPEVTKELKCFPAIFFNALEDSWETGSFAILTMSSSEGLTIFL